MKKIILPFAATVLLVAPSVSADSLKVEPLIAEAEVTSVDNVEERAVKVSWAEVIGPSKSIWTDAFALSSSVFSLPLKQVTQAPTTSWSTEAKVEYRLYKLSGSQYVDTGIYDIVTGSYTYPNAAPAEIEGSGSISSGTYKIKITNKTSVNLSVTGNLSM